MALSMWRWIDLNPLSPYFNRFLLPTFGALAPVFVIREALSEWPIPLVFRFNEFCDFVVAGWSAETLSEWQRTAGFASYRTWYIIAVA